MLRSDLIKVENHDRLMKQMMIPRQKAQASKMVTQRQTCYARSVQTLTKQYMHQKRSSGLL